jgi:hypothetical protein
MERTSTGPEGWNVMNGGGRDNRELSRGRQVAVVVAVSGAIGF